MYTLKEVAEILHVHYNTVYRYVQQGKVRAYLIGGKWNVPTKEIHKFLASVRNKTKNKGELE